jgi:hypothetical protein
MFYDIDMPFEGCGHEGRTSNVDVKLPFVLSPSGRYIDIDVPSVEKHLYNFGVSPECGSNEGCPAVHVLRVDVGPREPNKELGCFCLTIPCGQHKGRLTAYIGGIDFNPRSFNEESEGLDATMGRGTHEWTPTRGFKDIHVDFRECKKGCRAIEMAVVDGEEQRRPSVLRQSVGRLQPYSLQNQVFETIGRSNVNRATKIKEWLAWQRKACAVQHEVVECQEDRRITTALTGVEDPCQMGVVQEHIASAQCTEVAAAIPSIHYHSWLELLNLALYEVGNTDTSKNGMGNWE